MVFRIDFQNLYGCFQKLWENLPKMDGLFHGSKPYEEMDDLGVPKLSPYFLVQQKGQTKTSVQPNLGRGPSCHRYQAMHRY